MAKKYSSLMLITFLPALILFDLIVYLMTRATCFQCHNISEFVKNSSLAASVVAEAIRALKQGRTLAS